MDMGSFILNDIEKVIDKYDDGMIPHSRECPASYQALQEIKEIIYTGKKDNRLFRVSPIMRATDIQGI